MMIKLNTLRTFEIELPEPIISKCPHCGITEQIPSIYLNEQDALELYNQLDKVFGNY